MLKSLAIDRLELKRRVVDVEVIRQALAKRIEHADRRGICLNHDVG